MKITDIEVITFKAPSRYYWTRWGYIQLCPEYEGQHSLTRILTDEGVSGCCLGGGEWIERYAKPLLVGEDPLDRERLWLWMLQHTPLCFNENLIATLDMALWDLAGNFTGLPVHKLLGGCRDRVKVYHSAPANWGTVEDYADWAASAVKQGWKTLKIHPYVYYDPIRREPTPLIPSYPDSDIAVYKAVREQVGDDVTLMVDAVGVYNLTQAIRVGRELQDLNYVWFEKPMLEDSIEAYVRLCRELEIAVCAPEQAGGHVHTRAEWILRGATDIMRTGLELAGITAVRKTIALCEAFGIPCELHGLEESQLAILGSTSEKTCEYMERAGGTYDPETSWKSPPPYRKSVPVVDSDGYTRLSSLPGLGWDFDWDYINAHLVNGASISDVGSGYAIGPPTGVISSRDRA